MHLNCICEPIGITLLTKSLVIEIKQIKQKCIRSLNCFLSVQKVNCDLSLRKGPVIELIIKLLRWLDLFEKQNVVLCKQILYFLLSSQLYFLLSSQIIDFQTYTWSFLTFGQKYQCMFLH